MKGLQRSLSRGPKAKRGIVNQYFDLTNKTVTVSATGTAVGFGTLVLEGLPEGNILLHGAVLSDFVAQGSGSDANLAATWDGDYGVGSTPADDATISGTDVDIIASTAFGAATAEVSPTGRVANATPVIIDNTAGTGEVNVNVLIDAANITDDESVVLTLSGRLDIAYTVLGDD